MKISSGVMSLTEDTQCDGVLLVMVFPFGPGGGQVYLKLFSRAGRAAAQAARVPSVTALKWLSGGWP
jgi:hypothetical protein